MAQTVKNWPVMQVDPGSPIPEEENGNPLQYSCLENPTDRGAWRVTVHGSQQSRTRLSDSTATKGRVGRKRELGGAAQRPQIKPVLEDKSWGRAVWVTNDQMQRRGWLGLQEGRAPHPWWAFTWRQSCPLSSPALSGWRLCSPPPPLEDRSEKLSVLDRILSAQPH